MASLKGIIAFFCPRSTPGCPGDFFHIKRKSPDLKMPGNSDVTEGDDFVAVLVWVILNFVDFLTILTTRAKVLIIHYPAQSVHIYFHRALHGTCRRCVMPKWYMHVYCEVGLLHIDDMFPPASSSSIGFLCLYVYNVHWCPRCDVQSSMITLHHGTHCACHANYCCSLLLLMLHWSQAYQLLSLHST